MRVVDRETFLAMPSGTVFANYAPHCWDELKIKGDTVGEDFLVLHLTGFFEGIEDDEQGTGILIDMENGGESPPIDTESWGRDGFFDRDQRFAVLNRDDVKRIIGMLQAAVDESGAADNGQPLRLGSASPDD